jgi:exopolyphosphatase/guanosine-5'-triphosphate,3'-diphosphate pyrophosphatase
LEIVYAERFKIKKVISLPLGALRLTHQFDARNGIFAEKDLKDLKRYIWELLPNKKDLGINKDAKFVGVGGALRALARYEQRISLYPLDKIHNYKISRQSLNSTVKRLSKMKSEDISKISVIGSSRAETIIAGSCVIDTLMEKYGFSDLHVSNHGLREGALSIFLEDPKAYHEGYLTTEQIRKTIGLSELSKINPDKESLLNSLLSIKLISKRERRILGYAEKLLSEKSSFSSPQSVFYSIMDEDMPLNHKDQLVLGLSLVHARHTKTSDWLFARYKTILTQQDKISMKKISSLITLRKVLERTKSKVELKQHGTRIIEIIFTQSRSTQKFLLKDALRKFEIVFDVKVILSTRPYQGSSQSSILEM